MKQRSPNGGGARRAGLLVWNGLVTRVEQLMDEGQRATVPPAPPTQPSQDPDRERSEARDD